MSCHFFDYIKKKSWEIGNNSKYKSQRIHFSSLKKWRVRMKRRDSFCFSLPININWHLVFAEDYGGNPGVKTTKPLGTSPLWFLCRLWKSPDAGRLYTATKWDDSYALKNTISDFLNNCRFIFLWHPNTLLKTPRGLEKRLPGAVFRKSKIFPVRKGKCCEKCPFKITLMEK